LVLLLLICIPVAFAQKKKGDDTGANRTLKGVVTSPEETPVAGAVVQLKNTKNLQIRSFITKDDGAYYFQGLSTDVDFEVHAEFQGMTSPVKTLSSFDSRKEAILNLKLNKK
jgi:hypothetical protein